MAAKSSIRFLIRPTKMHAEAAQRKLMPDGAVAYVIGKADTTRADWVNSLRSGDVAMVADLSLLAELKSRKCKDPVADLWAAVKAVRKTGAVLVESSTGRRSDNICDYDAMMADAIAAIRSGKRRLNRGHGRPKTVFSPANADDIIDRLWHRKGLTRAQALEAIAKAGVRTQDGKKPSETAIRKAIKRMAEHADKT